MSAAPKPTTRELVELILALPPGDRAVMMQHVKRMSAKARRRRLVVINGSKTTAEARS